MSDAFRAALEGTLRFEGGYSNRPLSEDPGGPTNLGVTQATLDGYRRSYPADADMAADVKELLRHQAERIYRRLYWDRIRGDDLPTPVALVTFDAAVHSGPVRAVRWLQEAAGVDVDGHIGPVTLAAVREANPHDLAGMALDLRERFLRGLRHAQANPGWFNRTDKLREIVS